jgi:type VI secretion system protein ImpJ
MSWKNKVVWSEGLFLRPQHFQQQERYLESYVEGRAAALHNHSWGLTELTIDRDQLGIGKFAIATARGIFPDGTPFNIPEDTAPPTPLDITDRDRESGVFLALPVRQVGSLDIRNSREEEGLGRYLAKEYEARDTSIRGNDAALMRVGELSVRLLTENDERAEYACLGVGHVVECKVDKEVVLDDAFIPPLLDCQVSRKLSGFVNELKGLLHHRGEALASRVSSSGRGGAADIGDFLFLQAVNQYEPLVAHYAGLSGVHPEPLYRLLISMAGHLATIASENRRAPEFSPYQHDDLKTTFAPVENALRECLGRVLEQTAIPIPLKEPKYGIRAALISDRNLLSSSTFVLAVRADLSSDKIRQRFPANTKIGSVEGIRELVMSQLPGIGIRALPVAPRQIPYDAGSVYFELDSSSEHWPDLNTSGGFAIHVGGEFPGMEMDFWAIRG